MKKFTKDFTQQEGIPESGIQAALEILRSGRIHRYNISEGEKGTVCELEDAFASYMDTKYCLATSSCGMAIQIAMKSVGVKQGETILCNAYTLAPVPGAIEATGANVVFVDIQDDYTIDIEDLERKAESTRAKYLLLSHMRGHSADMDKISEICEKYKITLIEDCAHTMGATWNGKQSGTFGKVACFSTQTYKHMNSGEGGLLITNDPDVIAKAIIYSGSYMIYGTHTSRPDEEVFEKIKKFTPNYSCRMDHLRAALLLPQLADLSTQCDRWNALYNHSEKLLQSIDGIVCPPRDEKEHYVGSSIQFNIPNASYEQIETFLKETAKRGVQIKWFGNKEPVGFTSSYDSWQYFKNLPDLPNTKRILATMCDIRLPLTFTTEDCTLIVEIINEVIKDLKID